MRTVLIALLLNAPGFTAAQSVQCPDCDIGIYDDPGMSRNFGFWDASRQPVKEVWVGITFAPGYGNMTGVEFSVENVGQFGCRSETPCYGFEGLVEPAVAIGPVIAAPESESGQGGVNIAWSHCLVGDRAFVKLKLVSHDAVDDDVVLRVTRRFPPSTATLPHPWFTTCDHPQFAPVTVSGGCYVINPTVGPGESVGDCVLMEPTAIMSGTWSTIKLLYR